MSNPQSQAPQAQTITLDPAEVRAAGKLSPELEKILAKTQRLLDGAELAGEKGRNIAVAQLGMKGWGKELDERTRRALADWGFRYGVDPATEVYVLGDRIYLAAAFYLRKLTELIAAGVVEYAFVDYVHIDERLTEICKETAPAFLAADQLKAFKARQQDAYGEIIRRQDARIEHGIPEAATGASVFRVKLKGMEKEVTGAGWCGGNTAKRTGYQGAVKVGKDADPIGEMEPIKTSATRSARRCLRLVVTHIPDVGAAITAAEEAGRAIGIQVAEDRANTEMQVKETEKVGTTPVSTGSYE